MNWEDIIKKENDKGYDFIRVKLNNSPSGKIETLLHLFEQEGFLHKNSNPYDVAETILGKFVHLIDKKYIEQMIDEEEDNFNRTSLDNMRRQKEDEDLEW